MLAKSGLMLGLIPGKVWARSSVFVLRQERNVLGPAGRSRGIRWLQKGTTRSFNGKRPHPLLGLLIECLEWSTTWVLAPNSWVSLGFRILD